MLNVSKKSRDIGKESDSWSQEGNTLTFPSWVRRYQTTSALKSGIYYRHIWYRVWLKAQWKDGGFLVSLWLTIQSLLLIPEQLYISLCSTVVLSSGTAGNNKEQSSFHKSVSWGLHFLHTALRCSLFSKQEIRSLFVVRISCFRKTSELPNDKEKGWLPAAIGQSKDKTYCRRKCFAETFCKIILTWNLTWFAQPRSALSHMAPNFSSMAVSGIFWVFLTLALMHVPCPQWCYHRFNICRQRWISPPVIPNLLPPS